MTEERRLARQRLETYIIRSGDPDLGPTWQEAMSALDLLAALPQPATEPALDVEALRAQIEALPKWDKRTVPGGFHVNRAAVLALLAAAQPSAEVERLVTKMYDTRVVTGGLPDPAAAQPSAEVERLRRLLIYLWDAEIDDKFVVSDNFEPGDPLYEDVERERAALAGSDRP